MKDAKKEFINLLKSKISSEENVRVCLGCAKEPSRGKIK